MITKAEKTAVIEANKTHEGDTGSPEVQIAILTARINELTEHLKANKKDHSTRRGLLAMVSLRKKLLAFLMRENLAKYIELTDALGIRRAKYRFDFRKLPDVEAPGAFFLYCLSVKKTTGCAGMQPKSFSLKAREETPCYRIAIRQSQPIGRSFK